jgi:hypothetical protein
VQAPAGPQHAPHLGERAFLLKARQVVEHQRGEHAVEARVREGQRAGVSLAPLDLEPRARGLGARPLERGRIGVDPHDARSGMAPLDAHRERSGAAADLEHVLALADPRALDQPAAGELLAADRAQQGIVEREEQVPGRRGDVVLLPLGHAREHGRARVPFLETSAPASSRTGRELFVTAVTAPATGT